MTDTTRMSTIRAIFEVAKVLFAGARVETEPVKKSTDDVAQLRPVTTEGK